MIDIIESVAEAMRFNQAITSIIDNADNSYTISYSEDNKILRVGQTVVVSGSDNFDNSYTIKSLFTNSFVINKESGIVTTGNLGTAKQNAPFTDFGTWVSFSNFLDGEINFKNELEQETFPTIKLDRFETYERKGFNEVDSMEVFLIDFTKINLLDKDRITEMSYLKEVKTLFEYHLRKNKRIIDFELSFQDFRFAKLVTDNFTNVVRLKITNIQFLNCTIN